MDRKTEIALFVLDAEGFEAKVLRYKNSKFPLEKETVIALQKVVNSINSMFEDENGADNNKTPQPTAVAGPAAEKQAKDKKKQKLAKKERHRAAAKENIPIPEMQEQENKSEGKNKKKRNRPKKTNPSFDLLNNLPANYKTPEIPLTRANCPGLNEVRQDFKCEN